jgi:hypothetical protein
VGKYIWLIHLKHPPLYCAVINGEETQAERFPNVRLAMSPGLKYASLVVLAILQIERVVDDLILFEKLWPEIEAHQTDDVPGMKGPIVCYDSQRRPRITK